MICVVCKDILSWTACYIMTISRMKCNGKAVFIPWSTVGQYWQK